MKKPEQMIRLPQDNMKRINRAKPKSTRKQFEKFWEKVKKAEGQ